MKRVIAAVVCLMLLAVGAFAEAERTFIVDTDMGSMLITESGVQITGIGEYDVISLVTYGECPPERVLYSVSMFDIGNGLFFDDTEYEVEQWDELPEEGEWVDNEEFDDMLSEDAEWGDGWEDVEDVEAWPEEEGGLDESYDMEVVEDEEWSDGEFDLTDDMFEEDPFSDVAMDDEYFYAGGYSVALMAADGTLLTGYDYVVFTHDVENGVVAATDFDGFVTMLDEQGNVLAAGPYTSIVSDGAGGFFAVMPDIDAQTTDLSFVAPIVHITASGEIVETGIYTPSYEQLPGFSSGLMCVAVCDADGFVEGYAYINNAGEDVFGKRFEYAGSFTGGTAEIYDENYYAHLINLSGEIVTSGEYGYFEFGEDESLPVIGNLMDGGFDLLSAADGSVIASFLPNEGEQMLYAYHSGDNLIMAYSDNNMIILDNAGNVLYMGNEDVYAYTWYEHIDSVPQRLLITGFSGDEMRVSLADFSGAQKSEWYQDMTALSWNAGQGRYLVSSFEYVEVQYDDVTGYEPDPDTYRYGVIDQDGNVVLESKYVYFDCLDADRYWVCDGSAYILMDSNGNSIAALNIE